MRVLVCASCRSAEAEARFFPTLTTRAVSAVITRTYCFLSRPYAIRYPRILTVLPIQHRRVVAFFSRDGRFPSLAGMVVFGDSCFFVFFYHKCLVMFHEWNANHYQTPVCSAELQVTLGPTIWFTPADWSTFSFASLQSTLHGMPFDLGKCTLLLRAT